MDRRRLPVRLSGLDRVGGWDGKIDSNLGEVVPLEAADFRSLVSFGNFGDDNPKELLVGLFDDKKPPICAIDGNPLGKNFLSVSAPPDNDRFLPLNTPCKEFCERI